MTRDEAERARVVFLAALNESNPRDPIGDDTVFVVPSGPEAAADWDFHWWGRPALRSREMHRAVVIAWASVGLAAACFPCWSAGEGRRCIAGDCRSAVES